MEIATVTTTMIDEINKVNAITDRVKKRREECLSVTPRLCCERSRLVTESWGETEGELLDIRRAMAFKKIMEGLSIVIKGRELIVGSQTKYVRGAGPCVDYSPEYTYEQFETRKLSLGGFAEEAEVTEADKASLLEDANYWSGKSPVDAIRKVMREVHGSKIDDLQEAGLQFTLDKRLTGDKFPDFEKVLNKGLKGIIAEAREELQKLLSFSNNSDINKYSFLRAVIIACEAAIKFAQRYAEVARTLAEKESDMVRKKELEKIADICQWVPANPARSFYEALQSFFFIHLCVNLEQAYCEEEPGRMDQYLYPFYKKDLDEGRLTRQEAAELLGSLFIKFAELEVVKGTGSKEQTEANMGVDMVIGGVDSDGKDATNELTYMLLEVSQQIKTTQPLMYLRCHKDTPEVLWMKALEVNRERGDGQPCFLNDGAVIPNFVAKGIPIQEARDWSVGGCIHPYVKSGSDDRNTHINMAKIFEVTLNNGVDPRTGKQLGLVTEDPIEFFSFDDLYNAFKKQVDYFVDLLAKAHHLFWQVRNEYYRLPFLSAICNDCITKGMGVYEGGARYKQLQWFAQDRGNQNVADSLAAIKKVVFEEKKISMAELLEALASNFDGKDKLRQMLLAAPKYGNDDDYVDNIFNDLSLWIQRRMGEEEKKCNLGRGMRTGRGGASVHYPFGKVVGALPDGRKAREPLADGTLSPMRGVDVKGPTAVINSSTKINHLEVVTDTLLNMKFPPSVVKSREGMQKLIALIKTTFDRGGFQIQFNLMGQEVLLDAQKHPEEYRNLLVRVAGYSAYFVDLSREIQNEIIARTELTL